MALRPGDGARTLADAALAELREAIISGDLPAGSPLMLQELVDRLSMSSVPIREALRFLEQRGLVDRRPHRGVIVTEMSASDLEDTYSIRLDLESMAVRRATSRVHDDDRAHLSDLLDRYDAALSADNIRARHAHTALHMAIYERADSRLLRLILPTLWDNSERYRQLQLPVRGTPEQRLEEHRNLVDACLSGDADRAERQLRTHLSRTMDAAIALLREREATAAQPSM